MQQLGRMLGLTLTGATWRPLARETAIRPTTTTVYDRLTTDGSPWWSPPPLCVCVCFCSRNAYRPLADGDADSIRTPGLLYRV